MWCHLISMILASLSVVRGVSTIEPMNKVVVPILLEIILFNFYWAIFLPYADVGIEKFFSPNWSMYAHVFMITSHMYNYAVMQLYNNNNLFIFCPQVSICSYSKV